MSKVWPSPHCGDAFTLIELLVVIVIIGILTAIAFPVYNQIIVKSRQTTTLSNMRQVGAAFLMYAGDNNGQFPGRVTATGADKWPKLMSAYVQNLSVYNSPIPDYTGKQVTDPTLVVSNNIPNNTDYIGNGYNDINAYSDPAVTPRLSMIATPSQVILLGIKYQSAGDFYMDFAEKNEQTAYHVLDKAAWPTGSVYVFCDGSSRFLQDYPAGENAAPPNGSYYTDWLWLMIKPATAP